MALSTTPSLNANDVIALSKDAKLNGLSDTPFEAAVDVYLPVLLIEVGLLLREEEGVDAAI